MKTDQDLLPTSSDIRLDELSPTEWRVCDKRVDESDHLSILGFVELRNEHFEVTRMDAPGKRVAVDSLRAAREVFTLGAHPLIHR